MKALRISLSLLTLFSLTTAICYAQTAKDYFDKGLGYYQKGMYDQAIAECKKALEINPKYAEAHITLGGAYADKGMYDKAIAEYERAIEINPNYAEAHTNLGVAYADKGMYDKAIAEWKKAIEINPNDAITHNNLAVAYYKKGEYSLAIKHCDKAIEINKNRHELHFLPYLTKGGVLHKLRRYEEVIEASTAAHNLNPDYYWATYNIACSYSKWGDVQEEREEKEKKWSKALEQLEIVAKVEEVRKRAKEDTDFESLRKDEKFGKLFKKIIEQKRK